MGNGPAKERLSQDERSLAFGAPCYSGGVMRLSWLLSALLLSALIAFLQNYAIAHFLYWRYPWFDVPMHLLGGVVVAVTLVAVLPRLQKLAFLAALAAVFVGWEVFEYAFGIPRESNYVFDTALDLLNDSIGASMVYLFARMTVWR